MNFQNYEIFKFSVLRKLNWNDEILKYGIFKY